MRKDFTLIELMIVVAIIAIIAAIAIPNLLESRKAANETSAAATLKEYATAQYLFQKCNYAGLNGLTAKQFSPIFMKLGGPNAYVNAGGNLLELISRGFAEATTVTTGLQGYYFADSQLVSNWLYDFGLYADPCVYEKSGINSYFIDGKGMVMMKDLGPSGSSGNATVDSTWINP